LIGVPPTRSGAGSIEPHRRRREAGRHHREREEIRALRKELAEVKRANEILKTASAFFAAAELDRRLK
jgi:transposase-like protein